MVTCKSSLCIYANVLKIYPFSGAQEEGGSSGGVSAQRSFNISIR